MISSVIGIVLYIVAGVLTTYEWTKAHNNKVSKKAQLAILVLWWIVVGKWILEGLHEIFTNKK